MRLWHVSESNRIALFEPRLPTNLDVGVREPVVWAVDEEHLPNYLVPRDCPRVAFRDSAHTSTADRERFLGPSPATTVVALEAAWFQRALSTTLWAYELPSATFVCVDRNAGYFVSHTAVKPLRCLRIEQPLVELVTRNVELRVVSNLTRLAKEVAESTLEFSCIRLRNAVNREP